MFAPSELSPRARNVAAGVIHRAWSWISQVGAVGPTDAAGKRFCSMGEGSCLAFPPGAVFGERWIVIGERTLVSPHVSLAAGMPGEELGKDAAPVVVIGDRCTIGRGSSVIGRCRIEIGDDVTIGPNAYITDHNHSYLDVGVPIALQWPAEAEVRIGSDCWLGTGVTVLPGTDIGRHVTVAAGSVVRGRVPDYSVVAGSPARIVRRYVDGQGWVPPVRPQRNRAPKEWVVS